MMSPETRKELDQRAQEIDNTILHTLRGEMRKAGRVNYDHDVEDLKQTVWAAIMKKTTDEDRVPDLPQINVIAHNKYVDFVRKVYNSDDIGARNNLSLDSTNDSPDDYGSWAASKEEGHNKAELMIDLANMFPDSQVKEKKWLDFYIQAAGLEDRGIDIPMTRTQNGYTKSALAKHLGYKSGTADKAFQKFDAKMRNILDLYLQTK